MEDSFAESVENLRNKSRTLLALVDENIRRLNWEIQKHRSENSLLNQEDIEPANEEVPTIKKNLKSWTLRNDSTGVARVLHPDYSPPASSRISASMPDLLPSDRIVLTSIKPSKYQCTEDVRRRPVKGCYCNAAINKPQSKVTRRQKHGTTCDQFQSLRDFRSLAQVSETDQEILTPPISCETLRRVQKINYVPKSQFLRNVQNKVSQLQNPQVRVESKGCNKSSRYVKTHNAGDMGYQAMSYNDIKKTQRNKEACSKSTVLYQVPENVESSEDDETPVYRNPTKSSREICVLPRKHMNPRFIIKKTLTSKKSVPESKNEKSALRSPKNKRSKEAHCPCCTRSSEKSPRSPKSQSTQVIYYSPTVCRNYSDADKEYLQNSEVRDVTKFREQNYFETHGSSRTLASSRSSGSLEQCLLNERLFAEPARRIHKKDLVVTLPPCATVQRKRMHYFPRYIVKQKKTDSTGCHKKRRCQSCPMTGHAVDLGVLKVRPPMDSLALKYQKHN